MSTARQGPARQSQIEEIKTFDLGPGPSSRVGRADASVTTVTNKATLTHFTAGPTKLLPVGVPTGVLQTLNPNYRIPSA